MIDRLLSKVENWLREKLFGPEMRELERLKGENRTLRHQLDSAWDAAERERTAFELVRKDLDNALQDNRHLRNKCLPMYRNCMNGEISEWLMQCNELRMVDGGTRMYTLQVMTSPVAEVMNDPRRPAFTSIKVHLNHGISVVSRIPDDFRGLMLDGAVMQMKESILGQIEKALTMHITRAIYGDPQKCG